MDALLNNIFAWTIIGLVLLVILAYIVMPILYGCLYLLLLFVKALTYVLNVFIKFMESNNKWLEKEKLKKGWVYYITTYDSRR